MPEDLLLELETAGPIAASLENIEGLAKQAMSHEDQVRRAVDGMVGTASAFENIWRNIVIEVAKGQSAVWHAERPRLVAAFDKRLQLLKDTYGVAKWLHDRGSEHVSEPDVLLPEIAAMDRMKASVLEPWQTAEDLEDLAARDYPLTSTDLDQIGPYRQPPTSFYAEESKPF